MYYGIGSGPIFLDEVWCNGTESRLAGCRYKIAAVHDCNHLESASVTCKGNDTAVSILCMHLARPACFREVWFIDCLFMIHDCN